MPRFVHDVPMRWSDMDAYRHINNGAYLAYLEQVRIAMFFDRFESFSDGTVIARHEIDYLRPIAYHQEPLQIEAWAEDVRGASFVIRYEIIDGGRVAARAATKCVTIDFRHDRPRRLTDDERTVLRGYGDNSADASADDNADASADDGPA